MLTVIVTLCNFYCNFYCRRFWSGQPAVSGARAGAGKQCPDGVLCLRVLRRPRQIWTTTRAAERAAAC